MFHLGEFYLGSATGRALLQKTFWRPHNSVCKTRRLPQETGRSSVALSFWYQSLSHFPSTSFSSLPNPFLLFLHSVLCWDWNPARWGRGRGCLLNEVYALDTVVLFLYFFLSLGNLPGEKPNLCWLQVGATWRELEIGWEIKSSQVP